mgnify:CR=1 FL=1
MKRVTARKGFIMITTLIVISLIVVLIGYLINRSSSYVPYIKTMIDHEKAKELALGGIQMAISQLAYADVVDEKNADDKDKKTPSQPQNKQDQDAQLQQTQPPQKPQDKGSAHAKQFLKTLLPILNTWQTFKLDPVKDGIEGEIKICIMSEDGKINLNELYDFSKHTFVVKGLEEFLNKIKKIGEGPSAFEGIRGNFKERDSRLRDVTELITIKAFESFKLRIFYDENAVTKSGKEGAPLYLTDIFTIWSTQRGIDPWLISPSISAMLGLEKEKDKKSFAESALKSFKVSYSWPADWNTIFAKLYKKDFASLPKDIQGLLRTSFGPETFSVLSYGKVGDITHRLFAILVHDTTDRQEKGPAKVHIKKLYRM